VGVSNLFNCELSGGEFLIEKPNHIFGSYVTKCYILEVRKSDEIGGGNVRFILLARFRRRLTKVDTDKTDEIIKANPQVKVISIDWVLGRYDGVLVGEAPDEETWLKFVEPMSEYLTTETLVAIPRERVLKIIA